ncbi:MAG TPA: hypothetical protein VGD71_06280 [Kribbella sp.]|jgi:hypothetical protein
MPTLTELLDRTLPLNRKERYYTGTVLPAIVCAHNFAYLDRLSLILPTGPLDVRADPDDCTVLFFTEYGLSESAVGAAATRFDELPPGKDTPDVVILVTEPRPVLLALEAKLYDRPSKPDLLKQLKAQNELLVQLARQLGGMLSQHVELVHAALLPVSLAAAVGELSIPVITWEGLRDRYRDVAPAYFDSILSTALERYPDLVSKWAGYQDAEVSGERLVRRYLARDRTFSWMGRGGGVDGARIAADVATGSWRTFPYQCRRAQLPNNRNWFSVEAFIERLRTAGELRPSDGPADPDGRLST